MALSALDLLWLVPVAPLVGFLLLVVFGRRLGEPAAGVVATFFCFVSFVATLGVFGALSDLAVAERFHIQSLFSWISVGSFSVDAGLLADPLSITMCLFITGVGTLIHLYSIGYMHGDENFSKFFIYLNLFIASMLLLVLGDNMLITFLGWEGVGACSYLLISFWFTDPANASAGKKAFVTNRVGDFGFILATMLIFVNIGSINYDDILVAAPDLSTTTATLIVLLVMLAAAGKSAQLPLFVWLPDAMAGPTPVSALIHAATMVTSGVFLLTRLNPILAEAAVWATGLIAWLGAITALLAATAALAQNDIKKVLAYSTISQLGYMFMAVGVGAYVAAIFHMVTHAFFKALLFLGSGSVIHGLHGEQDMRHMGGLRKYMPVTFATFTVGWLAIAGKPPLSGFWSKDEILFYLWNAERVGGRGLWFVGLVTAMITAFYMTRQVILTFWGRTRFYDLTAEELDVVWENRLGSVRSELAAIEQRRESHLTNVEKFRADVAKREDGLEKARSSLNEAEVALSESSEQADGYDKLVKAEDKASKALTKATQALETANEKLRGALVEVADIDDETRVGLARLGDLELAQSTAVQVPKYPTAMTAAVSVSDLEEFLPESYLKRAELSPHESSILMTVPLVLLAALAILAGGLNLPFSDDFHFLGHWLEPSLFANGMHVKSEPASILLFAVIAVAWAIAAIVSAVQIYLRGRANPESIELPLFAKAWKIDHGYAEFFGGFGRRLFEALAWFDKTVVDGVVRMVAASAQTLGVSLRVIQPGYVRSYALGIGFGSVFLIVWFIGRMF